jgi:hypothetical protein
MTESSGLTTPPRECYPEQQRPAAPTPGYVIMLDRREPAPKVIEHADTPIVQPRESNAGNMAANVERERADAMAVRTRRE